MDKFILDTLDTAVNLEEIRAVTTIYSLYDDDKHQPKHTGYGFYMLYKGIPKKKHQDT